MVEGGCFWVDSLVMKSLCLLCLKRPRCSHAFALCLFQQLLFNLTNSWFMKMSPRMSTKCAAVFAPSVTWCLFKNTLFKNICSFMSCPWGAAYLHTSDLRENRSLLSDMVTIYNIRVIHTSEPWKVTISFLNRTEKEGKGKWEGEEGEVRGRRRFVLFCLLCSFSCNQHICYWAIVNSLVNLADRKEDPQQLLCKSQSENCPCLNEWDSTIIFPRIHCCQFQLGMRKNWQE